MRKLSLIAAVILGASFAYGEVMYWMVGENYAEEAKTLGDGTAATLYYVYGGTAHELDYLSGSDVAEFYPASVEKELGSYAGDGYSYFIELWNGSRTQEMDYATAKSNGYISGGGMITPTPASQMGFGGGTTSYNVPEPTSGLLFLIGGMLLGLKRRRQA